MPILSIHAAPPEVLARSGRGSVAHLHASYLGSTVLRALAERNHLHTAEVDDIIWGTSSQTGKQGGDLGRMAALGEAYGAFTHTFNLHSHDVTRSYWF
jgi:acetyl-CoA acetyltransferase